MPIATQEVELAVSAASIWLSLKEAPMLFPKIAPQLFSSMTTVEGTEGVIGSVRHVKFGPVAPEGSFVKEKLIALDHSTMTVVTEDVEGGHLKQGFTKWCTTIKLTAINETRTKLEATFNYEGENEAGIAQAKAGIVKVFSGLAVYLTALENMRD